MTAIMLNLDACVECGLCEEVFPGFLALIKEHGLVGANRNNPHVDWVKISALVNSCRNGAITVRGIDE